MDKLDLPDAVISRARAAQRVATGEVDVDAHLLELAVGALCVIGLEDAAVQVLLAASHPAAAARRRSADEHAEVTRRYEAIIEQPRDTMGVRLRRMVPPWRGADD